MPESVTVAMLRSLQGREATAEELEALAIRAGKTGGMIWDQALPDGTADIPIEAGKIPVSIQFESGKYLTWNMAWPEIEAAAKVVEEGFAKAGMLGRSAEARREDVRTAILTVFGSDDYLRPDYAKAVIPAVCWLLCNGDTGRQLRPYRTKLRSVGYSVSAVTPTQMRFRLIATHNQGADA